MRSSDVRTIVEYGVQTPTSRTVVLVTDQFEEAEHVVELVGEGCIVRRTVRYGPWRPVDLAKQSAPIAG
jgi:hypothetical protein